MRLRFQLFIFMLLRTILNTMHRMVYPFLAVFARGLGVDVTTLSLVVTVRSFAGMLGPLFAPIADKKGRKFGMLAGIVIFTFGVGLVAVYPSLYTLSAGLILALFGKYFLDPATQAYFGDRVPYEQRGTALAVAEMSWSLAFIVGVPSIAFLIARYGWSAPFPLLAMLSILMFAVIWSIVPHEDEHHEKMNNSRDGYHAVFTSIPALAGVSIALWASAANEMVNLVFGVWLEDSFGLKIAALAGDSTVIGVSELGGEGLVALTTDRLGKPRALALGLALNMIASILLPFIGRTQIGALVGLFFFYITFEYVMVSHIPMMPELVPKARATMLSLNIAGHSVGRALGALLATFIYQQFGFVFVALSAVIFNVFSLLALRRMMRS
ncbi:MAG: MFS transporter [Chloroflexi bacterium]|nr:MFS transporter [Chloroflexota bacterium]